MKDEKFILDSTAGGRSIWFDKYHENVIYLDKKKECKPDIQALWENLPFKDNVFKLMIWDPPHNQMTEDNKGIFYRKYGGLITKTLHITFFRAFKEAWRILESFGILILKWNTHSISANKILNLADGWKPLFGHHTAYKTKHSSQTIWFCFMKIPEHNKRNLKQVDLTLLTQHASRNQPIK